MLGVAYERQIIARIVAVPEIAGSAQECQRVLRPHAAGTGPADWAHARGLGQCVGAAAELSHFSSEVIVLHENIVDPAVADNFVAGFGGGAHGVRMALSGQAIGRHARLEANLIEQVEQAPHA